MAVKSKYQEIVDALLAEIDTMQAGDKIETEVELAARFSVSRMTIRQALQVLSFMGRISGVRGHGTFVTDPRILKSGTRGTSFTEVLTEQSVVPSTRLLRIRDIKAPPPIAMELGLSGVDRVHEVRRLRLGNGAPLCVETSYLSRAKYPDLAELNLELSLYELLRERYQVQLRTAEVRFAARRASKEEATLLEVTPGTPVMWALSTTHDERGDAAESTESVYRADRYEFQVSSQIGS